MCILAIGIHFDLKVKVSYGNKDVEYNITPTRKKQVKRLARKSYTSLVSSMVKSDSTSSKVITELSRKIKHEMQEFSSVKFDSILNDMYAALSQ